jgi:hypothetical protein
MVAALHILHRKKLPVGWLLLLAVAIFPLLACAQSGKFLERQVKAAYLYKFAGFVEWPEECFARPDSPLVIAVAGADPLAEQLETAIVGRTANGRALQVRRLRAGASLSGTHMLFIGAAMDKSSALELMTAARALPVLTVTDAEEGPSLGAIISFVIVDERLRFEVALKHAAAAHLRISARMLQAALRVQQVTS